MIYYLQCWRLVYFSEGEFYHILPTLRRFEPLENIFVTVRKSSLFKNSKQSPDHPQNLVALECGFEAPFTNLEIPISFLF